MEAMEGVVEEVEDELKALGAFVVGVGYVVVAGGEAAHPPGYGVDFLKRLRGGSESTKVVDVGAVHAYDQVEIVEIGWSDLTCEVGEVEASACGVDAHAAVG